MQWHTERNTTSLPLASSCFVPLLMGIKVAKCVYVPVRRADAVCSKGRFCFTCLNHLSKFGNDLGMLLMNFLDFSR